MHWSSFSQIVSQKHCSEPKNGFGGENGGWCIGDALMNIEMKICNTKWKAFEKIKSMACLKTSNESNQMVH